MTSASASFLRVSVIAAGLLLCGTASAQFANQNSAKFQYEQMNENNQNNQIREYSDDEYVPISSTPDNVHEGWQGMADFLKMLEPSADTSLPEPRTQTALRINAMIDRGQNLEALTEIDKYQSEDDRYIAPAADVQLMYLKGRALEGLGRFQLAMQHYQDMSYKYPELPEPWNSMGVLQLKAGLVDEAYESFNMAVQIRPEYGAAQKNLGIVNLIKASQALDAASKNGTRLSPQIQNINKLIKGSR